MTAFIHRTDIIPSIHERTGRRDALDLEAICAFVAIGYFTSDSTYYSGYKSLPPASVVKTDEHGAIVKWEPYFEWHHTPRDITLKQAVQEFAELFEGILEENRDPSWTIPISGGLDSRTLVAASKHLGRPFTGYSYAFEGGHDETVYGKRMSDALGFKFNRYTVPEGYLWKGLHRLAVLNQCYSDFTHPRQFAVFDELKELGGTFLLGHWGDVLFDDMHVPEGISADRLFDIHYGRILKPGGLELGKRLWRSWGLQGELEEYLRESLLTTYRKIDIRESNPRLRAFKSWTHAIRWASTNLELFRQFGPNLYPYMDNRMVEFICTVPEKWLAGRRIQIEYLKMRSPELARIPWQSHLPFNLYTYGMDRTPFNIPYRAYKKMGLILSGKRKTTRNWEIQFTGRENERRLSDMITGDAGFNGWVEPGLSNRFLENFLENRTPEHYHPVSMLLTLSAFHRFVHKPA
jgi:asparagine synthetase B (glutamine-hydrolysing)